MALMDWTAFVQAGAVALVVAALCGACGGGSPSPVAPTSGGSAPAGGSATSDSTGPAPPVRAVPPSEARGGFACGPFKTSALEAGAQPLLGDRMRVRFFPGGTAV